MIIEITGKDLRDRYYLPDEVIKEIFKDICKDFIGIEIYDVKMTRSADEKPESEASEWRL